MPYTQVRELAYRHETGLCGYCDRPMDGHIVCYLCGILLGESHISPIKKIRLGVYHCGRCHGAGELNWNRPKGRPKA